MATYFDQVQEAAERARAARIGKVPTIAVVLGSGLGAFGESLGNADGRFRTSRFRTGRRRRSSAMPASSSPARAAAGCVLALSGPRAFLRGPQPRDGHVRHARARAVSGVKTLIVTNAAGGINLKFGQGALMLMDDHINLLGTNPLIGPNDDRFGRRFPDMSEVYSRRLRGLAEEAAEAAGLTLEHGVYIAVTGPSYETPAEIRAFRTTGRRCRRDVDRARGDRGAPHGASRCSAFPASRTWRPESCRSR